MYKVLLILFLFFKSLDATSYAGSFLSLPANSWHYAAYSLWAGSLVSGLCALRMVKDACNKQNNAPARKSCVYTRTALSYMRTTLREYENDKKIMAVKTFDEIRTVVSDIRTKYLYFSIIEKVSALEAENELAFCKNSLIESCEEALKEEEKKLWRITKCERTRNAICALFRHAVENPCYKMTQIIGKTAQRYLIYTCCGNVPVLAKNVMDACDNDVMKLCPYRNRLDQVQKAHDIVAAKVSEHEELVHMHKEPQRCMWTPKFVSLCAASVACAAGGTWAWFNKK